MPLISTYIPETVWFQKISIPTQRRVIRGEHLKSQNVLREVWTQTGIPRGRKVVGWGFKLQKPPWERRGMDFFLEQHITH